MTDPSSSWLLDVSVGFNLATIVIPQSMAYAALAGLPPHYGLCTSVVPAVSYALFGQSRHVSMGTFALVSLMITSALISTGFYCNGRGKGHCTGEFASNAPEQYINATIVLSMMVGVLQILMALLKVGHAFTSVIADPVLSGFTSAAACLIIGSQLKDIFGLNMMTPSMPVYKEIYTVFTHLKQINCFTLGISLMGITLLIGCKKYCPRIPRSLFVIVLATFIVWMADLGHHVEIIGFIDGGLSAPTLPYVTKEWKPWKYHSSAIPLLLLLLRPALFIAIVSSIISTSISNVYALKYHYKVNSNREFAALGFANVLGGLFSAFPACGSLSRSSLVDAVGGAFVRMRHNLVTSILVILIAQWCTQLFYFMPKAILGAVIVVAVMPLLSFRKSTYLYRTNQRDFIIWILSFICTFLTGVLDGILLSIGFSILSVVQRISSRRSDPRKTMVLQSNEEDVNMSMYAFKTSSLHFLNTGCIIDEIRTVLTESEEPIRHLTLCCLGVEELDSTSIRLFRFFFCELESYDIGVSFTNCSESLQIKWLECVDISCK